MFNFETVSGGILRPATWRSTYILKTDQKVLSESLRKYGWVSPIIASVNGNVIIDGHERWLIAADDPEIVKRDKGLVPVTWVDCDDIEAMIMHVRLNRGRGQLYAKSLSSLLKKIVRSRAYDQRTLGRMLGMSNDEVDLLFDGGLLKSRKVKDHVYSKAWIPIEAPAGTTSATINIERPPNADR
jgi:ParB-like chromosome segregation protein Spo0J